MMNLKKVALLCAISLISSACSVSKNIVKNSEKVFEKPHWNYQGETGPEHWAQLEKDSDCGGKFQSPINIISSRAKIQNALQPLDIHFSSTTKIKELVNNGHSVQVNFEPGDYLNYKGSKYYLKQLHFHAGAEHTIDGVRSPLVVHLVNVNDQNKIVVIAIMVKEDDKDSVPFKFLDDYFPIKSGQKKVINHDFDLNLLFPKKKGYYNYVGSLTTPPSSEGVVWFVLKDHITISERQLNDFKKVLPVSNYRNTQPLNGRLIEQTN